MPVPVIIIFCLIILSTVLFVVNIYRIDTFFTYLIFGTYRECIRQHRLASSKLEPIRTLSAEECQNVEALYRFRPDEDSPVYKVKDVFDAFSVSSQTGTASHIFIGDIALNRSGTFKLEKKRKLDLFNLPFNDKQIEEGVSEISSKLKSGELDDKEAKKQIMDLENELIQFPVDFIFPKNRPGKDLAYIISISGNSVL